MYTNPDRFAVFKHTPMEDAREVPKLLAELQQMSRDCRHPINHVDRDVYLGDSKPRVRDIGERLNKAGGHQLMLWVCKQIPQHDQKLLECAWNGIGDWRA